MSLINNVLDAIFRGFSQTGLKIISTLLMTTLLLGGLSYAQAPKVPAMSAEEKSIADMFIKIIKEKNNVEAPEVLVYKTKFEDLYEVILQGEQFAYTNRKGSFLIPGRLLDGKSFQDLTAISEEKFSQIDVKVLPLDQAVKTVRGKGSRVMYTFEDPRCGYCKRLAQEVNQMDDVTVYTFIIGILGPESTKQSNDIWCAKDRNKAWVDAMVNNKIPASASCATPLEKNLELARKLKVNSTPAVFYADGRRQNGYAPKEVLEQKLNEVKMVKK